MQQLQIVMIWNMTEIWWNIYVIIIHYMSIYDVWLFDSTWCVLYGPVMIPCTSSRSLWSSSHVSAATLLYCARTVAWHCASCSYGSCILSYSNEFITCRCLMCWDWKGTAACDMCDRNLVVYGSVGCCETRSVRYFACQPAFPVAIWHTSA